MDINKDFGLRVWLNLGRREDRRNATEEQLAKACVNAMRFPAIDARTLSNNKRLGIRSSDIDRAPAEQNSNEYRGYENIGRYALALTQRLALRYARRSQASSILILEDDVVFHPNLHALLSLIELPDDWGIFYLGCTHNEEPQWVSNRLVRVNYGVDTHAIAVSSRYYNQVSSALNQLQAKDVSVAKASDQFIALLHKNIPTYACYPNLAWQATSSSDLLGVNYSSYTSDGRQRNSMAKVGHLLPEITIGRPTEIPPITDTNLDSPKYPAKLGMLFLTRGDVNHPKIWREYVQEVPDRVRIFSHPKKRSLTTGGFLHGTTIQDIIPTKWGDISLVNASLLLLKAAMKDESLTHFCLLSESCIPVFPLSTLLHRLAVDPRSQFDFQTIEQASPRRLVGIRNVNGIAREAWRFHSQWWIMNRITAELITKRDYTSLFEEVDIADESYFATVLSLVGYPIDDEVINRRSTWSSWLPGTGRPQTWKSLPLRQYREMIQSGAFFARKFPPGASVGRLGLHLLGGSSLVSAWERDVLGRATSHQISRLESIPQSRD